MRAGFLCVSVLRVASGPGVGLAGCGSALGHSVVCSAGRSGAVVPVLVLLFVALWFVLRGDLFYVLPCVILFLCFSVILALRLPRFGKRELILVLCVRFVLVWICQFPLPLGVWEGLRFVIVALPGLFSYLFLLILVALTTAGIKSCVAVVKRPSIFHISVVYGPLGSLNSSGFDWLSVAIVFIFYKLNLRWQFGASKIDLRPFPLPSSSHPCSNYYWAI